MRICLISKEYPPDTGWGGIGAYTYQISQGLKELGHDVEVVALAAKQGQGEKVAKRHLASSSVVQEGVVVHRVEWNGALSELGTILVSMPYTHFMFKTNLALWSKFAEIHKESPFDVVEAPEHLAEGFMPAFVRSVPVVVKLHTPQSKIIKEGFHNFTASFDQQFIAMLERISMLRADLLISPSKDLLQYVANDLGYPADEIKVVRNPVNANKFKPEGRKAIDTDGRLTVLFVGRLEGRKGIEYLVDAIPRVVASFANVRFVLIGADTNTAPGKKSMLATLKASLKESGCEQSVTFLPQVPLAEMPAYYRSADICIAPSLYDNAPYTCLEAMSCGRAFIGTTAGGMKEYVENGESGLIIPAGDVEAIAQALLSLLQDDRLRINFGENARRNVLANFHRTEIARQNVLIYGLAKEVFEQRKHVANYYSEGRELVEDAYDLLYEYHKMLYQLLYLRSFRFRLWHWFRMMTNRPRLFFGGIAVRVLRKLLCRAKCNLSVLSDLEHKIQAKEEEREKLLRQGLGVGR